MRLSYKWLQEYVDIRMAPEALSELLTMSGLSVDSVRRSGDDHIFDLEITSNRPDALSVIGIAREVAALTGKKLKIPSPVARYSSLVKTKNVISVKVEDKKLCPIYTARIVRNVKVGPSSKRLEEMIVAMGLRPVNNIVDITNFCLFEAGEPMHAFDLDKIAGGAVIVRKARKAEKIKTIDGVQRDLDETMLVIADRDRPIAVAGVIGGSDTEISALTKNILLEAAIFDPVSVRRTSRRLGISTESSYRFERRIDPAIVPEASNRACGLIIKESGGFAGAFMEIGRAGARKKIIGLRPPRLNAIVGEEIPVARVKDTLEALGCRIKASSKDVLQVEVPSSRQDIDAEIDLIEEVARVYGYNKIPMTLPAIQEGSSARIPPEREMDGSIRGTLASCGLSEILTYSIMSKKDFAPVLAPGAATVDVANPLSAEQEAMRPNLIPGLLKAVGRNINRREEYIALFEIGKVYLKGESQRSVESQHLSVGVCGGYSGNWEAPAQELGFFYLKGILETLVRELGIAPLELAPAEDPAFEKGVSASIRVGGAGIGVIGEVSQGLLESFDIKERVYALEISLEGLLKYFKPHNRYVKPPRYPSSTRDISIIVDRCAENAKITGLIMARGGEIVKDVRLLDRYAGKQIPDGKVGLTYRVEYLDPAKTLKDSRVNAAHAAIVDGLRAEIGAALRPNAS